MRLFWNHLVFFEVRWGGFEITSIFLRWGEVVLKSPRFFLGEVRWFWRMSWNREVVPRWGCLGGFFKEKSEKMYIYYKIEKIAWKSRSRPRNGLASSTILLKRGAIRSCNDDSTLSIAGMYFFLLSRISSANAIDFEKNPQTQSTFLVRNFKQFAFCAQFVM